MPTSSPDTSVIEPPTAARTAAVAGATPTVFCHIDITDRHPGSDRLACLTGWIVAAAGFEVVRLALRLDEAKLIPCNYPFHRADTRAAIELGGADALTGFNLLLPYDLAVTPAAFSFVAWIAPDDGEPQAYPFAIPRETGRTHTMHLSPPDPACDLPGLIAPPEQAVGDLLERRLFDRLARQRGLTLRLDLINKCNLRCVMCHYSNEDFARRPVQRIAPEQFAAFFEPIAPVVRDVMLSCGDEPLMSPHFEAIIRELAARDPEVRIRFCTNAMLLTEKIAAAIIAARVYMVQFSFDGICAGTLQRIRVGSDFRRVLKNILHLRRLRAAAGGAGPRFVFNFVMLESNIHEAPLFVAVARRLGGSYIDFRHVVPFDYYDIEHEMLEHFKPKYNHYRARIVAAAREAGIEVYLPPAFATAATHDPAADPVASLDEFHASLQALGEEPGAAPEALPPVENQPEAIHESAHYFCERPFGEVMIREQRDVYPCPWHREKMGTLDGRTTLEEIFFGENFRRVRRAMLDPRGAPGCSHCPIKSKFLPTQIA